MVTRRWGRGGRKGAEEARGGTTGEDKSGETRELSELSSGALAGRFLQDLTAGGLKGNKLRLTSSSQRQQMKDDIVSLAFWNCNSLSHFPYLGRSTHSVWCTRFPRERLEPRAFLRSLRRNVEKRPTSTLASLALAVALNHYG
eukprot:SAG31_NODE_7997_length_1544_cov_2.191696_2_plen_143_part_00